MSPTVKPVSISDDTAEGARAFVQHVKASCVRMFRSKGSLLPCAFIVGARDPHTCELGDKPCLSYVGLDPDLMESGESKDLLRSLLCHMALNGEAHGIAFCSETWVAQHLETWVAQHLGGGPLPRTIADRPDKKEFVTVSLQHRRLWPAEHVMMMAEIRRPRKGRPRLAGWIDQPIGDERDMRMASPRFQNLLPPDDFLTSLKESMDKFVSAMRGIPMPKERLIELAIESTNKLRPEIRPGQYVAQRLREMDW